MDAKGQLKDTRDARGVSKRCCGVYMFYPSDVTSKFKLYQHDATDSCDSGWLYYSKAPLRVLEV